MTTAEDVPTPADGEDELPAPDFVPRPETTSFAVVEEVAETITAVESLQGPSATPEMEAAAAEAAAEARALGLDSAHHPDDEQHP